MMLNMSKTIKLRTLIVTISPIEAAKGVAILSGLTLYRLQSTIPATKTISRNEKLLFSLSTLNQSMGIYELLSKRNSRESVFLNFIKTYQIDECRRQNVSPMIKHDVVAVNIAEEVNKSAWSTRNVLIVIAPTPIAKSEIRNDATIA
jgi:hypothetical protein